MKRLDEILPPELRGKALEDPALAPWIEASWISDHPETGSLEIGPMLRRHGLQGARALVAALVDERDPSRVSMIPWTIGLEPHWQGVAEWVAGLERSLLDARRDVARRTRARWARPWLAEADTPLRLPDDPVAAARLAWTEGRPITALRSLLSVWVAGRDPAVAEAMQRIAAPLYGGVLAPANEREVAIRLENADIVEYGALLSHPLASELPPVAIDRIDPRSGRWLVARIAVQRLSRTERSRWLDLRDAGDRLQDPLVARAWGERLPGLVAEMPRERWALSYEPGIRKAAGAADLVASLPAGPGDPEAELLAAVYADPDSDDARLVYADWLSERGDPRGELIQLQCHGGAAGRARVRQLLAEHEQRWSRSPRGASSVVFERGFPARATLVRGADFDDPAWATVHSLTSWTLEPAALAWPTLRRLRLSHPPDERTVLASGTLTALDLPWEGPAWELPDPRLLPAVRELVLRPRLARFRASSTGLAAPRIPLDRLDAWPLDVLGLAVPLHVLPAALPRLDAHPTLQRLVVWAPDVRVETALGWVVRFRRVKGQLAAAEAWIASPNEERARPILDVLPTLLSRDLRAWAYRLSGDVGDRLRAGGLRVSSLPEIPDPFADPPLNAAGRPEAG